MTQLKERLTSQGVRVKVPKRRITRLKHVSEDFFSLSVDEFKRLRVDGKLFVHWNIYGASYGYLKDDLFNNDDEDVVFLLNISRTVCGDVVRLLPDAKFVPIVADRDDAVLRLHKRAREPEQMIQERLTRWDQNFKIPDPFAVIRNISDEELSMDLNDLVLKLEKLRLRRSVLTRARGLVARLVAPKEIKKEA